MYSKCYGKCEKSYSQHLCFKLWTFYHIVILFRAAYFHKMKIKIIYYDFIRREWTSRGKKSFKEGICLNFLHEIPSWFMLADELSKEDDLIKLQHYRNDSNIQTQNRIFKWCSFHNQSLLLSKIIYCNKRALNESYKVWLDNTNPQ